VSELGDLLLAVHASLDRARIIYSSNQDDIDRRHIWSVAVDGGKVKIDVGDQVCELPVDDVEKANLVYEF